MKIRLITPAPEGSRTGNRTTALRWARLFEDLGHQVDLTADYEGDDADIMVALHASRSADAIFRFRQRHPDRPLVVALAGTDIYSGFDEHSEVMLRSLDCATALIGLHDLVASALPAPHRDKVTVIYQSAQAPEAPAPRSADRFEVLVVGYLRDVKDPLRTARAARLLPATSRIDVVHLGGAHTLDWARRAEIESVENPRYNWRGEVSGVAVRTWLSRARLMVLSSVSEGGANVISEAVAAGTPVLASRIDGSVGLLGHDYPGYFPTGDTQALADLLTRAEIDGTFLSQLENHSAGRSHLFLPAHERGLWQLLLTKLML